MVWQAGSVARSRRQLSVPREIAILADVGHVADAVQRSSRVSLK